jgi:hypothetical protein
MRFTSPPRMTSTDAGEPETCAQLVSPDGAGLPFRIAQLDFDRLPRCLT